MYEYLDERNAWKVKVLYEHLSGEGRAGCIEGKVPEFSVGIAGGSVPELSFHRISVANEMCMLLITSISKLQMR
jgi:hypothetical protein